MSIGCIVLLGKHDGYTAAAAAEIVTLGWSCYSYIQYALDIDWFCPCQ